MTRVPRSFRSVIVGVAAGAALLTGPLLVSASANAQPVASHIAAQPAAVASVLQPLVAHCGAVHYSQSAGGASLDCNAGSYQVRANVTCKAVFPLPGWTKYSPWATPNPSLGEDFAWSKSVVPSCPSPATYTTGVEYK